MAETTYLVYDRQGGCFGEYMNDKGGVTLKELQQMAVCWLYNDDIEDYNAPIRDDWSVDDIADMWELDIKEFIK